MDDRRIDALTAIYSDFTGHPVNFAALVREKKRAIVESTFSAEHERLAEAALTLARADWHTRDLSSRQLREALARVAVALPVYRTYRTLNTVDDGDRRILAEAVHGARVGSPEIDPATFDFLAALFAKPRLNEAESDFIAKWQQLTPAVMAKGVEDTTFYCFDRLVSCNEVGSQASLVGISADSFHEFCHSLGERWPNNLLANVHARQQAQRGCAHPHIDSLRDPRTLGRSAAPVVENELRRLAKSDARPTCRISAVSDADRRMAHRSRTVLAVHAEGVQRGENSYVLA